MISHSTGQYTGAVETSDLALPHTSHESLVSSEPQSVFSQIKWEH